MTKQTTITAISHAPTEWPFKFPWLVYLHVDNQRKDRHGNVYVWLLNNVGYNNYYSYADSVRWKFKRQEDAVMFYMTWM